MTRVLFVDDDVRILDGLRRVLRSPSFQIEATFANSGLEGLSILETQVFDVVVSDLAMPAMNGVQFLTKVRDRYPAMARVILSGHQQEGAEDEANEVSHMVLAKPCPPCLIAEAVERVTAMQAATSGS